MTRTVNIMPMAGIGKRFLNSEFKLPKPLIKIKINQCLYNLPKVCIKSDLNIFICNINLIKKLQYS